MHRTTFAIDTMLTRRTSQCTLGHLLQSRVVYIQPVTAYISFVPKSARQPEEDKHEDPGTRACPLPADPLGNISIQSRHQGPMAHSSQTV